jgi:hypothetical protein
LKQASASVNPEIQASLSDIITSSFLWQMLLGILRLINKIHSPSCTFRWLMAKLPLNKLAKSKRLLKSSTTHREKPLLEFLNPLLLFGE